MIRNTTKNQKISWILFLAYLGLLVYFMFFAESFGRSTTARGHVYNLELFKEIKRFYYAREQLGIEAFLLNVVGNIVAFMPCGFFLPIISRRGKAWYRCISLCFGLSLGIELTQLIFCVGSFDVDDLLLNTIGGALGFICFKILQMIRSVRSNQGE